MFKMLLNTARKDQTISEQKLAGLRGKFSFIMMGVALAYIAIDSTNRIYQYLPWYIGLVCIGLLAYILNRKNYGLLSTTLLLVVANLVLFVFADSDSPLSGVFFFFIGLSLVGLILLYETNRKVAYVTSIIPLFSGILAFVTDLKVLPNPAYPDSIIVINFIVNFILGTTVSVLITDFLIRGNYASETLLKDSERFLKDTTDELMRSRERYALALKGTQSGIYEWDPETNQVFVSDSWKKLLSYHTDELEFVTLEMFLQMIHPDDRVSLSSAMADGISSVAPYQSEIRLRGKDGNFRWYLDSGIGHSDENGKLDKVVGSIIDIQDRKLAEETILMKNSQLARMNEELDRFVYSASHDLRAPLSSLMGLVHLSELSSDPEELKLYNGMMRQRIKTMEGFIKEVTDYSRNARTELIQEPIQILSLLKEICSNLASIAERKIEIKYNADPGLIIHSDPVRLKIVLNNLVSNAYKYHKSEGDNLFIQFDVLQSDSVVILRVTDNGTGIDRVHHEKIFDMFYRATTISEGSGLGLYIVKETIGKMGGTISITSEIGMGSTFTIKLPALH